jgi:hypothetical protein
MSKLRPFVGGLLLFTLAGSSFRADEAEDRAVQTIEKLGGIVRLTGNRRNEVDFSGTAVTDAGLKELATFPGLRQLSLRGTRATDAGIRRLKALCRAVVSISRQHRPADCKPGRPHSTPPGPG